MIKKNNLLNLGDDSLYSLNLKITFQAIKILCGAKPLSAFWNVKTRPVKKKQLNSDIVILAIDLEKETVFLDSSEYSAKMDIVLQEYRSRNLFSRNND